MDPRLVAFDAADLDLGVAEGAADGDKFAQLGEARL